MDLHCLWAGETQNKNNSIQTFQFTSLVTGLGNEGAVGVRCAVCHTHADLDGSKLN